MNAPFADGALPAEPAEPADAAVSPRPRRWLLRLFIVGASIGLWFLTQALISKRTAPSVGIEDGMHRLLAPEHDYLWEHPAAANALMIVSSGFIDALAIFILLRAIFGPTIRPFIGLFLLFCLRQLCQMLVSLPEPDHMIWRYPGFPALLVTYGVATDLFFSGHTSVAVYGAIELSRLGKKWLALGAAIAVFEMVTVLTLRAHYTMDVFAAFMTAFFAARIAKWLAPRLERAVDRLSGQTT